MDYLTPKAKVVLIRLTNDEDTVEFAQKALQKHGLEGIASMPHPIELTPKVPLPENLQADTLPLLNLLETWQESLPGFQQKFDLEEISNVDHALSTLIVCLREANNGSK